MGGFSGLNISFFPFHFVALGEIRPNASSLMERFSL